MAKAKNKDSVKTSYTDEDLKDIMLKSLFADSNFRISFKDDMESCMRCWDILQNDKEFYKKYKDVIAMKISGMEEEVITGRIFNTVPTKADRNGSFDIAPGFLKLAELQNARFKWILEKRDERYREKQASTQAQALGVLILPEKQAKEIVEPNG